MVIAMSYGAEFQAGNGKIFRLDDINPYIYVSSVTLSGAGSKSQTVRVSSLDGLAELSAIFVEGYSGVSAVDYGNSAHNLRIGITAPNPNIAQVTVSANPAASNGNARYVFDIYARSVV